MFEERLFALVGTLENIAIALRSAQIPFELIGGAAIMVHVNRVEPSAVRNTKDLDIMVHRADLERINMLLPPGETQASNAVHLIFSGERVKANQAFVNPSIRPETAMVHGVEVAVAPLLDLLQMKLSNNRLIDQVHVQDLDSVGLISVQIEQSLPPSLQERLQQIRRME